MNVLCFSQKVQEPRSKTHLTSRSSSALGKLPDLSEHLYFYSEKGQIPAISQGWSDEYMQPHGEWLCKLSRDLLTLLMAMVFSQGATQVKAYIPDAIWYDYETVSEAARWARRPTCSRGGSSQAAVLGPRVAYSKRLYI